MRVTLLLADSAQAVGGKLYILGGGWSMTGPDPTPSAIAMKLEVPWDQANKRQHFKLELVDTDGKAFMVPTPTGDRPVLIEGDFEAGRPAGLKPGTPLDVTLAINIGPLPLKTDTRYVWRLSIDGHTNEHWQLGFTTRPAQQPTPSGPAGPKS